MKYLRRSFRFSFFIISSFFILNAFALEISDIDSATGHNWFKIINNSTRIVDFAGGDYRVLENGKSHLISTVSDSQNKSLEADESAFIVNSTSSFLNFNSGYSGIFFDSSFDLPNTSGYVAITDKDNLVFFACKSYGSGVCPNGNTNSTTSTTTTIINPPAPTSTTINTVYVYVPVNNQNKYGDINVLLPSDKVVPAGAEVDYTVKVTDTHGTLLGGLDFDWSFGDGGERFGKDVKHHYVYPGEYILMVTADGYTSGGQARMNIKVVNPDLKIIKIGAGGKENYIDLANNTEYDLFLSNFYLELDSKTFKLPKNFVIAKRSIVHLSGEATGFSLPVYRASLLFPNKTLLTSFVQEFVATSSASSTSQIATNTRDLAQTTIINNISNPKKTSNRKTSIAPVKQIAKQTVRQTENNYESKHEYKIIKKLVFHNDPIFSDISSANIESNLELKDKQEYEQEDLKNKSLNKNTTSPTQNTEKVKNVDIDIVSWFKSLIY